MTSGHSSLVHSSFLISTKNGCDIEGKYANPSSGCFKNLNKLEEFLHTNECLRSREVLLSYRQVNK